MLIESLEEDNSVQTKVNQRNGKKETERERNFQVSAYVRNVSVPTYDYIFPPPRR